MKRISATRYQQVVTLAGAFLVLIVLSGAAVRLTQSGLGCDDWPKCTKESLVPEWAFHEWVEFGNRLISGVIGVIVIAAALGAYFRVPRRVDLYPWAWGLVAGVIGQILLGGATVLVGLHPIFVSLHFLLSIVLLWNVIILWVKAKHQPQPKPVATHPKQVISLSRVLVGSATLVLILGTLVTGTGPNSGDASAPRFSFDLQFIARVHSASAWILVGLIVALSLQFRRTSNKLIQTLLALTLAQGAIGYIQYALGVPAGLVELHVAGSLAVWCVALWFHLSLFQRVREPRVT